MLEALGFIKPSLANVIKAESSRVKGKLVL